MTNELRIEHYLSELNKELNGLSMSQRAEIVTEIKSHISESLSREPSRDLQAVLDDLGAPKVVAERYLVSKGLTAKPQRRRGGAVFKWLAIGTVAFFALVFAAGMFAIKHFSPLVHVDEAKGRVTLFGGLIDVNEEIGQVKVGSLVVNDDTTNSSASVQGEANVNGKDITVVRIPFNTAKIEVKHTGGSKLTWDCKSASSVELIPEITAGVMELNLDVLNLAKCAIGLPLGTRAEFRGVNGHMELDSPDQNVDIQLNNGKVSIHPDPSKIYDFEVKVKNGLQDFFPRSKDRQAVKVKVNVVNGMVKKE